MSLQARRMRLSIDGTAIVDDAEFEIPGHGLVAVVGPNGAGKSTLLRLLCGTQPGGQGEVCFDGRNLLRMSRRERARQVAFVEQSAHSEFAMTVRQVVRLGRIPYQTVWEPAAADDAQIVEAALATTGTTQMAGREFATLSGGEQQHVQLARALAQQPRLLLLDEPTNHLDVRAQLRTLSFLRTRAGAGVTVLAALHDLNLAAAYCDHVVVMQDGRVLAAGATAQVLQPDLIASVYGVRADVVTHPTTGRPLIAFSDPEESEDTDEHLSSHARPYDETVQAGATQGA